MSSNRRANNARKMRGEYTRQELIKKHGLSTFREDPVENRELQKNSNINFTEQYGAVKHKSRFLGDPNTVGSTDSKRTQTDYTRRQNLKIRLGYPLSRGVGERTGDTLLIKCLEYLPPKGGIGSSLEFTERGFTAPEDGVTKDNVFGGTRKVKKGERVVTGYSDLRMNITDANSRMSRNSKIKYYVELPIPQEVNDSNIVTWGDDTMNIFQLAGVAAAANFVERPGATFQQGLDFIQKGIDLGGAIDSKLQTAIRNAIAGAAVNQLGGNVNAQNLIARTTGQVLNSNLELIFGGVNLRSFPFSITFTPRYEEEALEVKRIIRQFKMSMAAKAGKRFSGGSASGIFLNSPDVFSLRYMHNGQDHPFLNSFKICALTGMSVNYTNAGTYASYGDGSPVSIRLNMTFKELNPVYSEDYDGMTDDMGVGY